MLEYNPKIFRKIFRNILIIVGVIGIFFINSFILAKNNDVNHNINDVKTLKNDTTFSNKLVLLNDKIYYYKNQEIKYKVIDNFLDLIKANDSNFLFLNFYNDSYNLYLFSKRKTYFSFFLKDFKIKNIYSINQKEFTEYIGTFSKGNFVFLFFDKFIFIFEINADFSIKRVFKYNIQDIIKNIFKTQFNTVSVIYSYNNKILAKIDNDYSIFSVDFFYNKIVLKLLKRISAVGNRNWFIINQLFVDDYDLVLYSFFEKIGNELYYVIQDLNDNCYYELKAINSYESNYIILDKINKFLLIQNNNSIDIIYNTNSFVSINDCGFYVSNISFKNGLILVTLNGSGLNFYKFNEFTKEINPLFSIKNVIYAFKNQNYIYFIKKEESDYYYYLYFINIDNFINFFNNLDKKEFKNVILEESFVNFRLNFIPEKFFIFN